MGYNWYGFLFLFKFNFGSIFIPFFGKNTFHYPLKSFLNTFFLNAIAWILNVGVWRGGVRFTLTQYHDKFSHQPISLKKMMKMTKMMAIKAAAATTYSSSSSIRGGDGGCVGKSAETTTTTTTQTQTYFILYTRQRRRRAVIYVLYLHLVRCILFNRCDGVYWRKWLTFMKNYFSTDTFAHT